MTVDRSDELAEWYAEDDPDGAALLDDVESMLRRFLALPGEHCYVGVTLWAAHTHFIGRLETTPRLACLSPEPGSGKTRVLEVLDVLCANPLMALDISMAAFFRIVEDRQPSILLDHRALPIAGTLQWCGLPDDDARKLLALVLGGVREALTNNIHQDAIAQAGNAISAAEDWSRAAKQVRRRREIDAIRRSA